jgi:hypothetical protein
VCELLVTYVHVGFPTSNEWWDESERVNNTNDTCLPPVCSAGWSRTSDARIQQWRHVGTHTSVNDTYTDSSVSSPSVSSSPKSPNASLKPPPPPPPLPPPTVTESPPFSHSEPCLGRTSLPPPPPGRTPPSMAPARADAEGREASLAATAVPVHVSEDGRTREDQNEVVDTQELFAISRICKAENDRCHGPCCTPRCDVVSKRYATYLQNVALRCCWPQQRQEGLFRVLNGHGLPA